MNSNQRDKKLFRLAVETLRDELRASSEGTPIRCVGRLSGLLHLNASIGQEILWVGVGGGQAGWLDEVALVSF
jgi:hypothetical protein